MTTLTLGSYNTGNDDNGAVTGDLLDFLKVVQVGGLQECANRTPALAKVDDTAQVFRQPTGHQNKVALIARHGIALTDFRYVHISDTTEVERTVAGAKHDGTAEAKYIAEGTVHGHQIGSVHLVPSTAKRDRDGDWLNPKARRLYVEQVAGCVKWFEDGGDILVGDFNGSPNYALLAPLRQVADCYAVPSHGKREIDHVWVRKGSGIAVVTIKALGGYSSDHRPIVATLTLPEVKRAPQPPAERAADLLKQLVEGTLDPAVVANGILRPKVAAEVVRAADLIQARA